MYNVQDKIRGRETACHARQCQAFSGSQHLSEQSGVDFLRFATCRQSLYAPLDLSGMEALPEAEFPRGGAVS